MAALPELRVLVAHSPSDASLDWNGSLLHLKNPKSGTKACYLLNGNALQEIHWFKQSYSSWFIGDSVCEDGSLYLGSPVDPLFMALPILEQSRVKDGDENDLFRSLDEMMYLQDYPGYNRLLPILPALLDAICDIREVGGTTYYRLSNSKVLGWLCCKIKLTAEALRNHGSNVFKTMEDDELKPYTVGVVGEYLPAVWLQRLCDHLSVNLHEKPRTVAPAPIGTFAPSTTAPAAKAASNKKAKKSGGDTTGSRKITNFFVKPR